MLCSRAAGRPARARAAQRCTARNAAGLARLASLHANPSPRVLYDCMHRLSTGGPWHRKAWHTASLLRRKHLAPLCTTHCPLHSHANASVALSLYSPHRMRQRYCRMYATACRMRLRKTSQRPHCSSDPSFAANMSRRRQLPRALALRPRPARCSASKTTSTGYDQPVEVAQVVSWPHLQILYLGLA